MLDTTRLAKGARNLLFNCAGLKPDESVLIIAEEPELGWYDADAPRAIADAARNLGITPTVLHVGPPENYPLPGVSEAVATHDCTIYFSRIGDQDRFGHPLPGRRSVMCYARDARSLASNFGCTRHQAMLELKEAVNSVLLNAGRIEVRCPLGTDYGGTIAKADHEQPVDVSVLRFPVGVPAPVSATGFSGRVVLAGYLTPTDSRIYCPASLELQQPVFAQLDGHRILGFSGDTRTVERVREHYDHIAAQFDIDPAFVHSWHAGIHPGCFFDGEASRETVRWSSSIFQNPRFLHFHTCGAYAPGEICWMIKDPSVAVDGRKLWDHGRLCVEAFEATANCMATWPELKALFADPDDRIGFSDPGC